MSQESLLKKRYLCQSVNKQFIKTKFKISDDQTNVDKWSDEINEKDLTVSDGLTDGLALNFRNHHIYNKSTDFMVILVVNAMVTTYSQLYQELSRRVWNR